MIYFYSLILHIYYLILDIWFLYKEKNDKSNFGIIFDELLDSKYLKDEQKKLVQKIKDEVRENELNKQNSNI